MEIDVTKIIIALFKNPGTLGALLIGYSLPLCLVALMAYLGTTEIVAAIKGIPEVTSNAVIAKLVTGKLVRHD